jgi:SagB-type dehydrogenase family enzyme
MEKSLYDIGSLQQGRELQVEKAQQPQPFKIYQQTERYALHQVPPLRLGDPRQSFHELEQGVVPDAASSSVLPRREQLDYESLSTLLYYTYGFSRHDEGEGVAWPFHRFVASARCLFPTELYLWLPQIEHMPAGLYHYDNAHHSLVKLRAGSYRGLLAAALDSELDTCLGVLLLSSLFWKNAFKYLNFSYRLCTQEAGLVASNALMVASTLGFSGRVHYQFLDQPLHRLLGFEPDEESLMAVVPLYAAGKDGYKRQFRRLGTQTTQQSLCQTVAPLTLDYLKTSTFNHQLCSLLTEIDQHSFLENTTEMVTEGTVSGLACQTTGERISPPPAPLPVGVDLAQALHFRNSGDVDFTPLHVPLALEAFWEIVRYGLAAYQSDLQSPPAPPRLHLYLSIQYIEGIEAGIYRFCAACGTLHVIERGDFSMRIQAIQSQGNITSAPANLICYLVADYAAASHLFGNRAYRILNMEAGLIAQRISIMSAAQGSVARYSNSFLVAECQALLKLTETGLTPIAELVIGFEQPGLPAGNRYRFSLIC